MSNYIFPDLPLSDWQPTRDTIAGYAQVAGKIRRAQTPPQKHWWHVSLRTAAAGLTTTPIPADDKTFELLLDFTRHRLLITTSRGERRELAMAGQSLNAFMEETLAALAELNIYPEIDRELFQSKDTGVYDKTAVNKFWQAFAQIDATFKEFRHGFRGESSPVQLWPHHFDLALVWFSGRLITGQDPGNAEYADEQMNHGFSTGDGGVPEPYFYVTCYPTPEGLTAVKLPSGAFWHTEGWTGAILPYKAIAGIADGQEQFLSYLRTVHQAGSELLQF